MTQEELAIALQKDLTDAEMDVLLANVSLEDLLVLAKEVTKSK